MSSVLVREEADCHIIRIHCAGGNSVNVARDGLAECVWSGEGADGPQYCL